MNHRGLPHTRGYERDLVISVNIPIRRLSAWGGGGHRCWCRMKSALSIKAQHRRGPAAASGRTSWHIRYCPCFEYLRCKIINLPSINHYVFDIGPTGHTLKLLQVLVMASQNHRDTVHYPCILKNVCQGAVSSGQE